MDCNACAKMIELDLEEMGVNASCDFAKGTLKANLDNQALEGKISQVIEKSGYKLIPIDQ